jgi:hypothetical protein
MRMSKPWEPKRAQSHRHPCGWCTHGGRDLLRRSSRRSYCCWQGLPLVRDGLRCLLRHSTAMHMSSCVKGTEKWRYGRPMRLCKAVWGRNLLAVGLAGWAEGPPWFFLIFFSRNFYAHSVVSLTFFSTREIYAPRAISVIESSYLSSREPYNARLSPATTILAF